MKPSDLTINQNRTETPWGWILGLSAWVVLTIFSNHFDRQFDKVRRLLKVPYFVIPEWRFFAPNPPVGDTAILWRYLTTDGDQSQWHRFMDYPDRKWSHGMFFLRRRRMKEVFDAAGQITKARLIAPWKVAETPDYELIINAIRAELIDRSDASSIQGFQFMTTLEVGAFDTSEHRLDFVSSFEPLKLDPENNKEKVS